MVVLKQVLFLLLAGLVVESIPIPLQPSNTTATAASSDNDTTSQLFTKAVEMFMNAMDLSPIPKKSTDKLTTGRTPNINDTETKETTNAAETATLPRKEKVASSKAKDKIRIQKSHSFQRSDANSF